MPVWFLLVLIGFVYYVHRLSFQAGYHKGLSKRIQVNSINYKTGKGIYIGDLAPGNCAWSESPADVIHPRFITSCGQAFDNKPKGRAASCPGCGRHVTKYKDQAGRGGE